MAIESSVTHVEPKISIFLVVFSTWILSDLFSFKRISKFSFIGQELLIFEGFISFFVDFYLEVEFLLNFFYFL